jgi:hypothetical protein
MTKVIEVSDQAEPLPKWYNLPPEPEIDPDKPIFDRGESSRKEPMSLAELEAAVIPKFLASQRKTKLAPVVVYTPEMHRQMDSKYYSGRPRSTGSETRRRSVNSLGRLVGEHGAHKVQGAYGAFKDASADDPVPIFQPAPEVAMGYCHWCNRAIRKAGTRAGTKFCPDKPACARAYRYREGQRNEFNKAFKDYWETAKGKAEAVLQADARHAAAVEMTASARRCGIEADFFATSAGVVARSDAQLPPARFKAMFKIDHPEYGAWPAGEALDVQISDVPELGATLYAFSFPMQQEGAIGKVRSMDVMFLGDPGPDGYWGDDYLPPEQAAAKARRKAEDAAEFERWKAGYARRERARAERKARGGPGTTSAREAHQEERMRNLVARPDHDVIIREFEEAKDWGGLRDFYQAKRQQKPQKQIGRDNPHKDQSKQRVS